MISQKIVSYLLIVISAIAILVIGKNLLIPFILALLVWFLISEIRRHLTKLPLLGEKIPQWIWTIFTTGILFLILGIIVNILVDNIQTLSENLPAYEANLISFGDELNKNYQIDVMAYFKNFIGEFDLSSLLGELFSSLTDVFGNAFMIILYVLFILLEESIFGKKIRALFTTKKRLDEVNSTLTAINKSISSYITLKTLISIITGACSYIALAIIGVDAPIFWAFLIFLLNFIPTIGSLIGTVFPALIALMQFGDAGSFFLVLGIVGSIQLLVGNIIEPKLMGNSLNSSPLAVVLALSFWGAIWGITGMVLSVPITVIMIILFAQFNSTKPIAILLSEKGSV